MKTKQIPISPTNVRIYALDIALTQFIGTTPLSLASTLFTSSGFIYYKIATVTNTSFEPIFTSKYTVDINGKIYITSLVIDMGSYNDNNGVLKVQMSGDGGNTFIDMTDEMGGGELTYDGPGLWIKNIEIGSEKLQSRILGKSTDGNPADLRIMEDSVYSLVFHKEIF